MCLPLVMALLAVQALPQCYEGRWSDILYQCQCGGSQLVGVCQYGLGTKACGGLIVIPCESENACDVGSIQACGADASAAKRTAWSPATSLVPKPRFLLADTPAVVGGCGGGPQLFLDWARRKLNAQRFIVRNLGKS